MVRYLFMYIYICLRSSAALQPFVRWHTYITRGKERKMRTSQVGRSFIGGWNEEVGMGVGWGYKGSTTDFCKGLDMDRWMDGWVRDRGGIEEVLDIGCLE
jgi:hypothetical protein